ncbi:hypothetical protein ERJ75_000654100 [Trypanosoma vivax]|nr:hypothetical protein ERJ75_000654100 [Trypanosoma vivax]
MRERSGTCAFLAACVLLALLGLRAHAAGKEPMEVNGAKLFCELSGTLKKVAKEIAAQLTARQGGCQSSAPFLCFWRTGARASARHGGGRRDNQQLARKARRRHGRTGQGTANGDTRRDIEREARARADEIDSLVHLFARTRGAQNYCIKAEDSTAKPNSTTSTRSRGGLRQRLRMRFRTALAPR